MLDVHPDGEVRLDPMFKGPELSVVRSTFGYMDRTPDPARNPFTPFQNMTRPYLPNLISLQTREEQAAQPR